MYDFNYSWPYDYTMGDLYFQECPYCGADNVLISEAHEKMQLAREEVKTHFVMPCCLKNMTVVNMDDDYVWATEKLREIALRRSRR